MNAGGLYGTLRRERLYLAWKELLNDGKFSDVVISTCGKSFPGHKAVLSGNFNSNRKVLLFKVKQALLTNSFFNSSKPRVPGNVLKRVFGIPGEPR